MSERVRADLLAPAGARRPREVVSREAGHVASAAAAATEAADKKGLGRTLREGRAAAITDGAVRHLHVDYFRGRLCLGVRARFPCRLPRRDGGCCASLGADAALARRDVPALPESDARGSRCRGSFLVCLLTIFIT